jgi:predicted 3-demethylubiquinone-9 3-methyltransferase (glyoxalase superfamily)
MLTERFSDGLTRITRGDGSTFTYRSACSATGEELAAARAPYDHEARMEEVVDDTLRTLVTGGYFFPEGFKWLRDNFGVSFDGKQLHLAQAAKEMAMSVYGELA